MQGYVDIAGHSTWVSDTEAGDDPVLMLHGGLSNSDELLDTIGGAVGARHRVLAFDRLGHGRTADAGGPFHYADMAGETIAVLETVVGGPADLVGWSDGGIIALLVAMRRPDLVNRQVLIGANYHYSGLRPLSLGPDSPIGEMIEDAYATLSPDGADHYASVYERTMTMFTTEPTLTVDDLATIAAPTLVLVGDDDLIELSHTVSLYEALPAGRLAVVPATTHAVPMEAPDTVARLVLEFLASPDPPETLLPSRRA